MTLLPARFVMSSIVYYPMSEAHADTSANLSRGGTREALGKFESPISRPRYMY